MQYRWHALYGQPLVIRERRHQGEVEICRCVSAEACSGRSLEIPAWMFEARWQDQRVSDGPASSWSALVAVDRLLVAAVGKSVLVAEDGHSPESTQGDAHASDPSSDARTTARVVRPSDRSPFWEELPANVRQDLMRLLVQMLREHREGRPQDPPAPRPDDE